ncbi:radical SAM protein [bacterium]|nr:radical SAM protein [bacterium]
MRNPLDETVSPILAAKRANRLLADQERNDRKVELRSWPLQVQVEPTNRCNLACDSCARNYYDGRLNPAGDFEPLRFYPHIDELFGRAERVLLGGYGEPLLGTHAEAIVRLAKSHEAAVEIINNGTTMTQGWIELCRELSVDRVLFSIDGATDERMRELRGVGLDKLLHRARLLRDRAPGTSLAFNVTVSRRNLDDIPRLVEIAADVGIADVFVMHQKLYHRRHARDSALREPERLAARFDEAAWLGQSKQVAVHLPPTGGVHECFQPLELMMIRHDGEAFACCSAAFQGGKHPRVYLGRLGEKDPPTLWNAKEAMNARRRIHGLPYGPGPCDNCGFRVFTPQAMERYRNW